MMGSRKANKPGTRQEITNGTVRYMFVASCYHYLPESLLKHRYCLQHFRISSVLWQIKRGFLPREFATEEMIHCQCLNHGADVPEITIFQQPSNCHKLPVVTFGTLKTHLIRWVMVFLTILQRQ